MYSNLPNPTEAASAKSQTRVEHLRKTTLAPLIIQAGSLVAVMKADLILWLQDLSKLKNHKLTSDDLNDTYKKALLSKKEKSSYYADLTSLDNDINKLELTIQEYEKTINPKVDQIKDTIKKAKYNLETITAGYSTTNYEKIYEQSVENEKKTLTDTESEFITTRGNILQQIHNISNKIAHTRELMATVNKSPEAIASTDDAIPPATKPSGFIKRHWKAMLIGGLLVAAGAASAVFTLGIPHLIAATGIALSLAAQIGVTVGAGVLGAGIGAGMSAGAAKVFGRKTEKAAPDSAPETEVAPAAAPAPATQSSDAIITSTLEENKTPAASTQRVITRQHSASDMGKLFKAKQPAVVQDAQNPGTTAALTRNVSQR